MKTTPRIGLTSELKFVVAAPHTIDFHEEGLPPVLSTPSLIWFLEHAAIDALKSVLEPGEISVGTEIEVRHLAATPLGASVTCTARVIQTDGPAVGFQVEARDDSELIARGFHQRRVIRAGSLARRVLAKAAGCSHGL